MIYSGSMGKNVFISSTHKVTANKGQLEKEPAFLVNIHSDPLIIQINGKASYLNSPPLRVFLRKVIEEYTCSILVDCKNCTAMDSTFLGLLVGVAVKLRKAELLRTVTLCRIDSRNLETVRNLGLHHILHVEEGGLEKIPVAGSGGRSISSELPGAETETDSANLILKAHEYLIDANEENRDKFQDIVNFLKATSDE